MFEVMEYGLFIDLYTRFQDKNLAHAKKHTTVYFADRGK
jgi:hypothetical protein